MSAAAVLAQRTIVTVDAVVEVVAVDLQPVDVPDLPAVTVYDVWCNALGDYVAKDVISEGLAIAIATHHHDAHDGAPA